MSEKHLVLLATGLLLIAEGCGGAPAGARTTTGSGGTVVTDNPMTAVAWTQLNGRSSVAATMRVNDSGTTVTEIPVNISRADVETVDLAGREETGVETVHCTPTNGRGVFEGDSGSPVLVGGSVAGGLFGSSDGVNFEARGIEQMEATGSGPPVARPKARTPSERWHIRGPAGLMTHFLNRPGFGNAVYEGTIDHSAKPIIGAGVNIIPGLRYASPFVLGTYVEGYDLATYTFENSSGQWLATAHGLEDAGAVSWPVMAVSVIGPNADGTIHATPTGAIYGTLLYDGEKGSLINPNSPAQTMSVTVNLTFNGLSKPVSHNQVRFDKGSSTEDTAIESTAQSTLQAELQGLASSFGGSGTIQLTLNGSTLTKNLNFQAGQTLDSLISNASAQIDAILTNQHDAEPANQIESVTIDLQVSG